MNIITSTIPSNHRPIVFPRLQGNAPSNDPARRNPNAGTQRTQRSGFKPRRFVALILTVSIVLSDEAVGLVIILGSQYNLATILLRRRITPSSHSTRSPTRHLRKASVRKGLGNKSRDEDCTIEEDVRYMKVETDTFWPATHHSYDLRPSGDTLLSLAPCKTHNPEQNRAVHGEVSWTPHQTLMFSHDARVSNSFDRRQG